MWKEPLLYSSWRYILDMFLVNEKSALSALLFFSVTRHKRNVLHRINAKAKFISPWSWSRRKKRFTLKDTFSVFYLIQSCLIVNSVKSVKFEFLRKKMTGENSTIQSVLFFDVTLQKPWYKFHPCIPSNRISNHIIDTCVVNDILY